MVCTSLSPPFDSLLTSGDGTYFLLLESGLILRLLWPFRRLEKPCLGLETSASCLLEFSLLLECSSLGCSLLEHNCCAVRCLSHRKKPHEVWKLDALVNSPCCAPSRQPASTTSQRSGPFWTFQPTWAPGWTQAQPTSHEAELPRILKPTELRDGKMMVV